MGPREQTQSSKCLLKPTRTGAADGYPADGLARTEVVSLLRGPASSSIVLTISRQGFAHSRAVYLERRPMTQPPLKEVCAPPANPHCSTFHLHSISALLSALTIGTLRSGSSDERLQTGRHLAAGVLGSSRELGAAVRSQVHGGKDAAMRAGHAPQEPMQSWLCMQARILLSSDKRPASYMRMFYVSSQATQQVAARLREGEADDVAGYVIDLRNNPGVHPA